ncbi:inositol monophosphatase family protein [Candidatus Venteria ishoeyi]|nr:inositol monophosphatase family protein [Candidatus Venteria ishoeyi]
MHPMLNTAIKAARRAGNQIVRAMDHLDGLSIEAKGTNDFVSEVDRNAEKTIIETLLQAYPDHGILAEESGIKEGKTLHQWIIDPLDGTTNFLHGHPQFAVSIALKFRGKLEQAVVYNPMTEELFTATLGRGAFLNNRRIRVSQVNQLRYALLGTGFPFREERYLEIYLETFRRLFPNSSGVRRAGSAALDLAYIAAGRLDGFWEFHLQPWDIAAGALLIKEAGGMVTDMKGGEDYFDSGDILAGNLKIHQRLQKELAECLVTANSTTN